MEKVCTELFDLAAGLASTTFPNFSPNLNVKDEYKPQVTDVLDSMLELIDESLDELQGKRKKCKIEVKEPIQAKKKFLQLENDMTKVATVRHKQIFVPENHPYEAVIKALYGKRHILEETDCIIAYESDMSKTPFEYVATKSSLDRLAVDLEGESIFAVDLEHHSFHSYHGYTCLIQLSTMKKDYIVDTIILRDDLGPVLSPAFADPNKLKVLHGAKSDIKWLQRDFNIFIVNMFDTAIAAKTLQLGSYSLAALLSRYVSVQADKKYQLADWRTRPLSEAMLKYAQMDTHYLLHIYSVMRAELFKKDPESLLSVLQSSTESALALFKPIDSYDPSGWRSVVGKASVPYSEREISIIKAICVWRELVAREEDESPPAVLPNHMILRLASGSFVDPKVVLSTAKYPLRSALKHVDELGRAITNRRYETESLPKLVVNVAAKQSVAVAQACKMERSPVPEVGVSATCKMERPPILEVGASTMSSESVLDTLVPVTIAVQRYERPSVSKITFAPPKTTSLMSSMFHTANITKSDDALVLPVASAMSIRRVSEAASTLLNAYVPLKVVDDRNTEMMEPDEVEKPVEVLRTGKTVLVEDILKQATQSSDQKISLSSSSKKRQIVEDANFPDLQEKSKRLFDEQPNPNTRKDRSRPREPSKKQEPTFGNARLSSIPKSGNRSMSFVNKK
jgi:ribonuclease D